MEVVNCLSLQFVKRTSNVNEETYTYLYMLVVFIILLAAKMWCEHSVVGRTLDLS